MPEQRLSWNCIFFMISNEYISSAVPERSPWGIQDNHVPLSLPSSRLLFDPAISGRKHCLTISRMRNYELSHYKDFYKVTMFFDYQHTGNQDTKITVKTICVYYDYIRKELNEDKSICSRIYCILKYNKKLYKWKARYMCIYFLASCTAEKRYVHVRETVSQNYILPLFINILWLKSWGNITWNEKNTEAYELIQQWHSDNSYLIAPRDYCKLKQGWSVLQYEWNSQIIISIILINNIQQSAPPASSSNSSTVL